MIFFLLVFVALYLIAFLLPLGLFFGFLELAKRGFSYDYFTSRNNNVAYALDVVGGVLYAEFFEFFFLTPKSKYRFIGNTKLSISAILGANKHDKESELNKNGYAWVRFLDWIDHDKSYGGHCRRPVVYKRNRSKENIELLKNVQ